MVLWFPTGTAGFFFRRDIAILSSFRMAGKSIMVEKALIKANSSCLSMMFRQELQYTIKTPDLRCGQCEQVLHDRLEQVSSLTALRRRVNHTVK